MRFSSVSVFLVCTGLLTCLGAADEPAAPTHIQITTSFSKTNATGGSDTISSPTIVTTASKQATVSIGGNGDGGITFSVTPTLAADGSIALKMDTQVKTKVDPSTQNPDELRRKQKEASRQKTGMPLFHSALPSDGLYSVEDVAGVRRWVKVGRVIDGWTVKSYDAKREILTISQLGRLQELTLHKAVIDGATVTTGNASVATVKSGETTKFTTPEGVEVTVTAEVLNITK